RGAGEGVPGWRRSDAGTARGGRQLGTVAASAWWGVGLVARRLGGALPRSAVGARRRCRQLGDGRGHLADLRLQFGDPLPTSSQLLLAGIDFVAGSVSLGLQLP